jgi:uncharacterized Ntn-hydrolase superfamily protein
MPPSLDRTRPRAGRRLASTFSIVARDPRTEELGVAVQSHYFSVGSDVPWAKAGVGAIATQSFVEVSYGPKGLRRLARGDTPAQAIRALTAADPGRATRQVGIVDARGRAAAWTGKECIAQAGHAVGRNVAVQGNLLGSPHVWPAMAHAFESRKGRLAERLVAALEAGQRAGGDARGMQSASLLVVGPGERGKPWTEKKIDLRVEDDPRPIAELGRLLGLLRAYERAGEAERTFERDRNAGLAAYDDAVRMAPSNDELRFWRAGLLMRAGREDEALIEVRRAIALNPRWRRLLGRLTPAHFAGAQTLVRRLRR